MDKAQYIGNCTQKSSTFVHSVMDKARTIGYETLVRHVGTENLKEYFPSYQWGSGKDLRLKDDYAVSFHRSKVKGKVYYIVEWSRIEFFFLMPIRR